MVDLPGQRPRPQYPVVDRLDQVAGKKKKLCGGRGVGKALSLHGGLKPSHGVFLLPGGLVCHFGVVGRIDVVEVMHRRHDRAMSGVIASMFVDHQPSPFTPLAFEEATEEAFGRALSGSFVGKDVYMIILHWIGG